MQAADRFEPEVVRTPRGSVDLTNRLVLLLSPGVARAPAWGGAASPRAVSEPRLDAWVSTVLPDPGSVRCAVTYTEGGSPHTTHMTLAQLGLAPLDALELAAAVEHPAQSELEQRLHYRAARSHPAGSDFAIAFAPDASSTPGDRTFPEFLELARAVRDLLAGARALAPQDLLETERIAAAVGGTIDNTDLSTRAADAMMQLQTDLTALQAATTADDLRAALLEGSLYGGVGAIPVEPVASDAAATASLGDQRTSVARELGRRLTQAQNDDAAFDRTHATPERLRDHLVALLQTVFGRGFTVLPRFTAPAAADFDAALDAAGLLAGDADAPERWLAQLVPIRAGVWRYDALRTLRALVSGDRPEDLHVAQLPHSAGERWLALPFDPATPPPSHRVGIVADVLPGFDPTASQCGLVLDEWIERIPVQTQSTGLAFHYDQPTARAPQAVVFALAPEGAETWDDAALATVLSDTLSLARARGVDLEMLPALGQLLPTLFFPFNVGGETVSLDYYDIR